MAERTELSPWEEQLAIAETFDEYCADRSNAWLPPIMAALVAAASRTDLIRCGSFRSRVDDPRQITHGAAELSRPLHADYLARREADVEQVAAPDA